MSRTAPQSALLLPELSSVANASTIACGAHATATEKSPHWTARTRLPSDTRTCTTGMEAEWGEGGRSEASPVRNDG